MSEPFTLGGDPGSIRASSRVWAGFSTDTATACSDVRSLDTTQFQGDEADLYRTKVNDDLPPRLETTSQAWQVVSAALTTYAGTLEDLQARMAALQATAADQSDQVNSAQQSLSSAQSADRAHTQDRLAAAAELEPNATLPADPYRPQTGGARSSLTSAQQALQDTIDAAATLRAEHNRALDACCTDINRAKDMRFADPPGFWGSLGQSVGDWITEHADVLTAISSVLKTISAVAGLLSFIPVLAPIMGPIALVTGAAALGIDVAVKLATGEGSWTSIVIDGATMLLPGVGKLVGKGLRAGAPNLVRAVDRGGLRVLNGVKNSAAGRAGTAFMNTRAGTVLIKGPGRVLDRVNTGVERGLSRIPGADKYLTAAARRAESRYVANRLKPASADRQEAMQNYMDNLRTNGHTRPVGDSNEWQRYQAQHSDLEYNLAQNGPNGTAGSQWADGLDPKNASIGEMKYKEWDGSKSQRNLLPDEGKPPWYDSAQARNADQMQAYTDRLAEASNPMDMAVYYVAQPSQVDYYLDIAADLGVGDKVVVVHSP